MINTNMWMLYLTATILSVIQIQDFSVDATECRIQSLTSNSASSLNVVWNAYADATVYQLELRVINSTSIAAVIVTVDAQYTQKLVQGLRPGHNYEVIMKVLRFLNVVSTCKMTGMTVPGVVQITVAKAVSSSSISFEWSSVTGAASYSVHVDELFGTAKFQQSFTTLSGKVTNLKPSSIYNCYIIASNSAGNGVKSSTKTITTLVQPPTGVNVTSTGKSTARVTWNTLSGVIMYEVTVTDTDPSNPPVVKRTTSTTMDITQLEPCSNYTVGVSSLDSFLVPGEPNQVSYVTSNIQTVTTITEQYNCSTATVTVTWDLVFGANSYVAIVTDGTGASLNCTSLSTSCQINMLKCGEKYTVRVTAISDDCSSISTMSRIFDTVPCAPANPEILYTCSSNGIIFKWEHTNNTLYYVAKSIDMNNAMHECRTQNNMCFFTNVGCGENYTYTVQSISSECNSENTEPKSIKTSPCLPENIKTSAECNSDTLTTTWNSAAGAQSYKVRILGNTEDNYNCTSATNSCVTENVPCGEQLSVWVSASNEDCTTSEVLGEVAQTTPCTPTNVSASNECSPDTATVSWVESKGVVFYIATAEDSDGIIYTCFSMGTYCLLENLRCGQTYNASVIGTNLKCNSSASAQTTFETAPCPPTNVVAQRDCDNDQVSITWENHQPTGLYTAVIEESEDRFNCTSNTQNSCIINSPTCGKTYTVVVTYNDSSCSSSSTPVIMDSVPCKPENVAANVTCITGELTVTWTNPEPAQEYVTKIIGGTPAQTQFCNSTDLMCIKTGLECGTSYVLTVYSLNGSCSSLPSSPVTVQTIPCPPTNIAETKACLPNPSTVTWTPSASANSYIAEAVSTTDGLKSECKTNQMSCSFNDLQCGQVYIIGVSGVDATCTGAQSSYVSLSTEPCSPVNVTSMVDCQAGSAMVSWSPRTHATNYSVMASSNGSPMYCHGPNASCTLNNLDCNQQYDISVTASDEMCTSNESVVFTQEPVPCAPQNVQTSVNCNTNNIDVSWDAVSVSWDYNATAILSSGQGTGVTCSTSTSTCTLSGLQCGQNYTVTVFAFSGSCIGPDSTPVTVTTAPCGPASLTTALECGTNSLNISLSSGLGAATYTVTVFDANGFSKNCSTTSLTCEITGLQCATQYNVSAIAVNNDCNSSPTQLVITTGPCDPTNVNSVLICGSDSATVTWDAASGAQAYTVLASEVGSQYEVFCKNSTTSCQLNQLTCGKTYALTVLSEDATCNSTGAIASLNTAPCSPSIQYYNLTCGTNSSSVTWTTVQSATGYTLTAETTNGDPVSCTSVSNECTLNDLQCSKNYTATVVAEGNECDSAPSQSFTISTVPCPPSITTTQYNCSTSKATISWSMPEGSTGFHSEVVGGFTQSCDSTDTSCEFQNLPCGLSLYINVKATGSQCDSEESVGDSFETAPCAPENVSSTLICENDSAMVTWAESSAAVNYTVTAAGQNLVAHCHNVSTNCMVEGIQCGQDYNITVTSHSATCTGYTSDVHPFKAGLCAPTSASVTPGCHTSTVTWTDVTGAEKVVATADDNGQIYTCESNTSNSCNFTDMPCGGNYSVSVLTVDRGCNSMSVFAGHLIAVQCPPTNLDGDLNCQTSTVTLTWDQSTMPGVTYSIQKELMGNAAAPDVFTVSGNTYPVTNLQCGERYNFSVAANDGNCLSSYSPPIQISTAPCEPTSFTARVDCGTNNGNFSWSESRGATSYTVLVTGEHGHEASCSSNDTSYSCLVKLDCGRFYSATLVAFSENCNTTKNGNIVIESAPCLPEDVEGVVDCDTNVMNVTWKTMPAPENYTAWAISSDGHNASCTSESNFCSISDLECGRVYDVVVSASSIHCDVIAGSDYKVQSAPCKAENMGVDLNCSANAVTVKWTQLNTNQNNTVTATSDMGMSTCQTPDTSCNFLDLSCGTKYTFTVQAHTNVCMSANSTMEKTTAPCAPTNVSAQLDCATKDAVVTWVNAAAADSYDVEAQSSEGHSSSCSSITKTCNLQQLACGQMYTVLVKAVNTNCTGPVSTPATFITEPCLPINLTLDYTVGVALVQWAAAKGADSYSVEAVTDQGTLTSSNTTTSNQCELSQLLCGETYNVSVTAHNQACNQGVASENKQLLTEPCPPTNIQANVQCEQHGAMASWDLSDNAASYVAFFLNENGDTTFCAATSTQTSCGVTGLECGTVYTVWVIAVGLQFNSTKSNETSLTTNPCQPSNINVTVDCEAKTATIAWQPSSGALSYVTELTSSNHSDICSSNSNTNCQPSHLHCGEEYNVSVTAVGEGCNTTGQMSSQFYTEPCEVTGIAVHYTVGNASVQWDAAKGATSYSAEAVTDQGALSMCNHTSTQCSLVGLQCSEIYNVTVTAYNQACDHQGVTSGTVHLTTEPCPPSNVQATVACELLEATISWDLSNFAVGYRAYINNTNGDSANCDATSAETSCVITGLVCDSVYSAWAIAKGEPYNSSKSAVISFTSAPCLPQNIDAQADCGSDGAGTVSWTANGGANITVSSFVGGNLQTLCTTQQNSCPVSGLNCGQTYNLTLNATNEQCTLMTSTLTSLITRPCPLTGVLPSLDCVSGQVTVNWQASVGADRYTATLDSGSGISKNCTSQSTTCSISGLDCGHNFSVSVTASNPQCTINSTEQISQPTAPCVPADVDAVMNCTANTAAVSWSTSQGAQEYTVTGQSSQHNVSCQTSGLTCSLANLKCGTLYTIQVVASDNTCSSAPSQSVTLMSAPCPPENVNTSIDCTTNNLTVSWDASGQADYYLVSLIAQSGSYNKMCNTTSSTCTLNSILCGNRYTAQVTSVRGSCHSQPSLSGSTPSAPCQPQGINGTIDCIKNSARITWDSTLGANSYTVLALGEGGHTANCTTSTNTTCEVDLECATLYNFSVTAKNSLCESLPSGQITLETAPCSLTGIRAFTQCHNSSILVQWDITDGGQGDTVYIATAEGSDLSVISCNNTGTSCLLQGAQCGLRYTIVVSASSDICSDMRSPPHHITTEPCKPSTPQVLKSCGDAVVSWDLSAVAEMYHVVAVGDNGHEHTCNTTFNNCTLSPLHCDQQYSVTVVASHENCSSHASPSATLNTGPCEPDNLSVTYDCNNHTALLMWMAGSNAVDYYASAQDEDGSMLYCHSPTPNCTFEGLQCGSQYNFTVLATDGDCNSSFSNPLDLGAVPCPPENVHVQLLPQMNEVQILSVSWTPSDCNNTEYLVKLTGNLMGSNETKFDISSYWTTESFFELPLPCSSEYWATVESRNGAGSSGPSKAASGSTAPCPPTSPVHSGDTTSLTISWSASALATNYTVYENSVSPRSFRCRTETLSCTLSNTVYVSLVVTASNEGGESEATLVTAGSKRKRRDLHNIAQNELMLMVKSTS